MSIELAVPLNNPFECWDVSYLLISTKISLRCDRCIIMWSVPLGLWIQFFVSQLRLPFVFIFFRCMVKLLSTAILVFRQRCGFHIYKLCLVFLLLLSFWCKSIYHLNNYSYGEINFAVWQPDNLAYSWTMPHLEWYCCLFQVFCQWARSKNVAERREGFGRERDREHGTG